MKLKFPFRKKKKYSIRITKAGWIYILITIFLGIASANTGNNLVYLISASFLAFMGISGIVAKINLEELNLEVFSQEEVFAGRPTLFKVVITNKKKFFPAFLIEVKILDKYITFPLVNKKEVKEKTLKLVFLERGVAKIDKISLCSVFPFNFFERCIILNKDLQFLVFPKPEKYELFIEHSNKKSKNRKENYYYSNLKSFEGDIEGFSKYYPGIPLKYISWKHYAKTGELIFKEFKEGIQSPIIIDLENLKIPNVEKKVSFATYLVLKAFKNKIPIGLKTKNVFIKPSNSYNTKYRILKELALYGKY